MQRTAALLFALALVVLAPIYAAYTSPEFGTCQQHQGQYPTAENNEDKASTVLVPPPADWRVLWSCAGGYTNANGSAITAIATVLLTIVTGLLGYLAWKQAESNKSQLRARVLVFSTGLNVHPNEIRASVSFQNYGPTPATEVTVWLQIVANIKGNEPAPFPERPTAPRDDASSAPMGTATPNTVSDTIGIGDGVRDELVAGNRTLIVHGDITYKDIFGNHQRCDFRLRGIYTPAQGWRLYPTEEGNKAT